MRRSSWLRAGLVIVIVGVILLAGCVSKEEYDALQIRYEAMVTKHDELQTDYNKLRTDYEAASEELRVIKEVYPPRDFSSLSELNNWLASNDVSERPRSEYAGAWYAKALEIQEDALKDGYIISADYEYYQATGTFLVYCVTIISGDVWYWDPETDEPLQDYSLGKVK